MVKKIVKRVIAGLMAFNCLLLGITAYANSIFSTIYSGKLSFNDTMYMDFSESNAEMHRVYYKSDAGFRFLTALKPSYYYLSKDHLYAEYVYTEDTKDNLYYTYSDGTFATYAYKTIYIQTEDVSATFWLWGSLKSLTVTYNGRDYSS